jgi:hypothetical protein
MGLFALGHAGHRTCKTPSHDHPGLEISRKLSSQRLLGLIGSRVYLGLDLLMAGPSSISILCCLWRREP